MVFVVGFMIDDRGSEYFRLYKNCGLDDLSV